MENNSSMQTTTATTVKVTENERKLLRGILKSEYHNGADETKENRTGQRHAVWVDCIWGFEGKRGFGGVMASLTKKGLAGTDGEGCWLTEAGYDLITADTVTAETAVGANRPLPL